MIDNKDEIYIRGLIKTAIKEDIGEGDHTSRATIDKHAKGRAQLLIKEDGIIAGIELAKVIFHEVDPDLIINQMVSDGDRVVRGDIGFIVEGTTRSILASERLVLNFMQRMSGIATKTSQYVSIAKDFDVQILDTRKTTPGIRAIEKWAVRLGGGANHRIGLWDLVMIKDNHIDFCGGIEQAIDRVSGYLEKYHLKLEIEIETRSMEEVRQVLLRGGVTRIMLDNFEPAAMREAVTLINKRFETEASGNINLENIREYAATGVDFISVGALTHSVKAMDMSLKSIAV